MISKLFKGKDVGDAICIVPESSNPVQLSNNVCGGASGLSVYVQGGCCLPFVVENGGIGEDIYCGLVAQQYPSLGDGSTFTSEYMAFFYSACDSEPESTGTFAGSTIYQVLVSLLIFCFVFIFP